MSAGKLGKSLSILFSAVLLSGCWAAFGLVEAAEEEAGLTTVALVQVVESSASASPSVGTLNLDGLVAYSSILSPENNPKTQGDAYLRRIAGTPRSPEPTVLIVMGLGLLGLAGIGKKIKKR